MNELISVIVPVYKAEKYLDRCVESLVNQSYENIEILLIDDGSPDGSGAICDRWAEKNSKVRVIHNKNQGVMYTRLCGAEKSKGEYILFVDSDDWIDLNTCTYLHKIITENNAQIACIDIQSVKPDNINDKPENADENINIYDFTGIFRDIAKFPFWSVCGKLYKRELFDNVPRIEHRITVSEDMMYNYFLYKQTDTVVTSAYKMYFYFNHRESAIAGEIKYSMIDDSMLAYKIIDDDFDKSHPAYEYQVINKIQNDFFLINSIIRNNKCLDRYDILREDIFNFLKLVSEKNMPMFNIQQRVGLKLLRYCPKLYNKSILLRKRIRGY